MLKPVRSQSTIKSYEVAQTFEAFYTGGSIALSIDGEKTFCQFGNRIHVISSSFGTVQDRIGADDDPDISCFLLSNDNKYLFVAHTNLVIRQWSLVDKELTRHWKSQHLSYINCLAVDDSDTLLASASTDSSIKIWDTVRKYCTHFFRPKAGLVSCLKFYKHDTDLRLLSAGEDYMITVWDLGTSSPLSRLAGHLSRVTSVCVNTATYRLLSCGLDKVVIEWDLSTYEKIAVVPVYQPAHFISQVFPEVALFDVDDDIKLTDCCILVCGRGDIMIWNYKTATCVYSSTSTKRKKSADCAEVESGDSVSSAGYITNVIYSQKSRRLILSTFDHNLLYYSTSHFTILKQLSGDFDEVYGVCLCGSEERHVAVATNSPDLRVISLDDGGCKIIPAHTEAVMDIAANSSRTLIVTASKDNTVRLWRWSKNEAILKPLSVGYGHSLSVTSVAFSRLFSSAVSSDAEFVVSASSDCTIKLWLLNHNEKGSLKSYELKQTAALTQKAHDKEINCVTVSPNNQLIATCSTDKTAKVFRRSDLSSLAVLRGHNRGVWSVQFSPLDKVIASCSIDGKIKIWSLNDFSCLKTLEGHGNSVTQLRFLSRGMHIISGSCDGLVKVWQVKSDECIATLEAHSTTGQIWAIDVTSDDSHLITGATDSKMIVWKDVSDLKREESDQERVRFIEKEQKLSNLIKKKRYEEACLFALELEQPHRLLTIITEARHEGGEEGSERLTKCFSNLSDSDISRLLRYAAEWNTTSKHCHEAQFILHLVLTHRTLDHLLQLPNIRSTIAAFIPYTERHVDRINKLSQDIYFIDYTLYQINRTTNTKVTSDIAPADHTFHLPLQSRDPSIIASVDTETSNTVIDRSIDRCYRSATITIKMIWYFCSWVAYPIAQFAKQNILMTGNFCFNKSTI